jgi:transposase
MSESSCPGCVQRDALIAALQQRIEDLERQVKDLQQRLGGNASNSSLTPSANPPAAPPAVVKRPTGRKSGGQPGHPGHQRLRLPPQRVRHVIALVPSHCQACQTPLPQQPSAAEVEPVWHQFAELPRVSAAVTEFQGHSRTCPRCGQVTRESIPAEIRAHAFGPRLAAVLSYLSGTQYVSQRGLEDVAEVVFGAPCRWAASPPCKSR